MTSSLWGKYRPTRAKEIIYTLFTPGHMVSPIMKVAYDRIVWLIKVAQMPGDLQNAAQSKVEAICGKDPKQLTTGPVQRALHELRSIGWKEDGNRWTWIVPAQDLKINLATAPIERLQHQVRDSMRRHAWGVLETRHPRQYAGMGGVGFNSGPQCRRLDASNFRQPS